MRQNNPSASGASDQFVRSAIPEIRFSGNLSEEKTLRIKTLLAGIPEGRVEDIYTRERFAINDVAFLNMAIYNGPGLKATPLILAPKLESFLSRLGGRDNPEEVATALQELGKAFDPSHPIVRYLLYQLAEDFSPEQIKAVLQLATVDFSFLKSPQKGDPNLPLMLIYMTQAIRHQKATVGDFKEIAAQLKTFYPAEELLPDRNSLQGKWVHGQIAYPFEQMLRAACQYSLEHPGFQALTIPELFEILSNKSDRLQGILLNGKTFPPPAFPDVKVRSELSQMMKLLRDYCKTNPERQIPEILSSQLALSTDTADLENRLEGLCESLRQAQDNPEFQKALTLAHVTLRDREYTDRALPLIHKYRKAGGNPIFMALFLEHWRPYATLFPLESLFHCFPTMKKIQARYTTSDEVSDLCKEFAREVNSPDSSFLKFKSANSLETADIKLRLYDSFPGDAEEVQVLSTLSKLLSTADDLHDLESAIQFNEELYKDLDPKTHQAEMLFRYYYGETNPDKIRAYKKLGQVLTEIVTNKKYQWDVLNSLESLIQVPEGKKLPTSTLKALCDAFEARKEPLRAIPQGSDFMSQIVHHTLFQLMIYGLTPEGIGDFLDGYISMAKLFSRDDMLLLEQNFNDAPGIITPIQKLAIEKYLKEHLPDGQGFGPEKVKWNLLLAAANHCHTTSPESESQAPLRLMMNMFLKNISVGQWPDYLEAFSQSVGKLSKEDQAVCYTHGANTGSMNTLGQCIYQIATEEPPKLFQRSLETMFDSWNILKALSPSENWGTLFLRCLQESDTMLHFEDKVLALQSLMSDSTPVEARQKSLLYLLPAILNGHALTVTQKAAEIFFKEGGDPRNLAIFLGALLENNRGSEDGFRKTFLTAMPLLKGASDGAYIRALAMAVPMMAERYPDRKNMMNALAEALKELPDNPEMVLPIIEELQSKDRTFEEEFTFGEAYMDRWYQGINASALDGIREGYALWGKLRHPRAFLNHFMLHRDKIHPLAINSLLHNMEFNRDVKINFPKIGKNMVPEILALIPPYLERLKAFYGEGTTEYRSMLNQLSTTITSFNQLVTGVMGSVQVDPVSTLYGIAINNLGRIGALGLSYTKWQYDTMKRWKGQGPMQQPSLFEKSGFFQQVSSRPDDSKYHGGFVHYNPQSGLSIEMRRAYLVISKPGLGSLVIRNSSPDFGRDLLKEPAYYHPDKVYTDKSLFNPEDTIDDANIEGGIRYAQFINPDKMPFQSILSHALNREDIQQENHGKITALLNAFDEEIEPYVAWKCGFKDGKPPEGFKEILQSALMSAKTDGAMTPFGKKKNIRLAWVNRFGLPHPVMTYDVKDPAHQQELETYLKVLERKTAVTSQEGYEKSIPTLLEFLKEGLSQNLELILTE